MSDMSRWRLTAYSTSGAIMLRFEALTFEKVMTRLQEINDTLLESPMFEELTSIKLEKM